MRILDIPQSGKCGTFVSVRTRYGQIRRRYAVPRKSPSEAQIRIRAAFARVVALWRLLSADQRAAWAADDCATNSRSKVGQCGRLPAYVVFMKVNATLAALGEPLLVTPPQRPKFSANVVGDLVATNTGGEIDLKLSVPSAPTARILVLATHPRSAGVTFANHFAILCVLPPAEAGYSNITERYVARYGVPPVGTSIFIRTRQILDGWEDDPKQTAAIVPKP